MPHFMIILILYIKPFLARKCLFLRNMEPLPQHVPYNQRNSILLPANSDLLYIHAKSCQMNGKQATDQMLWSAISGLSLGLHWLLRLVCSNTQCESFIRSVFSCFSPKTWAHNRSSSAWTTLQLSTHKIFLSKNKKNTNTFCLKKKVAYHENTIVFFLHKKKNVGTHEVPK